MLTVAIRWKIQEYLEQHGITAYRLMKHSGLTQGTVYRLANNEIGGLNSDTLNAVMRSLRELADDHTLQVGDLVEYVPDSDE